MTDEITRLLVTEHNAFCLLLTVVSLIKQSGMLCNRLMACIVAQSREVVQVFTGPTCRYRLQIIKTSLPCLQNMMSFSDPQSDYATLGCPLPSDQASIAMTSNHQSCLSYDECNAMIFVPSAMAAPTGIDLRPWGLDLRWPCRQTA